MTIDHRSAGAARAYGRAAAVLGLVLAAASPAAADGVKLPLTPPQGASETIADYIAICSTALTNVPAAGQLALERGWKASEDDGSGLEAGAMAAAGMFSGRRDDGSFLNINRVQYPHVIATNCQIVLSGKPDDLGASVLSKIDGVVGGGGIIGMAQPGAGLWSFVDDTGRVVTMTAIPAGSTGVLLTMERAELTELGKKAGAKPAG